MKNNDENKKMENIKSIVELLTRETPEKVSEILAFIKSYLSKLYIIKSQFAGSFLNSPHIVTLFFQGRIYLYHLIAHR